MSGAGDRNPPPCLGEGVKEPGLTFGEMASERLQVPSAIGRHIVQCRRVASERDSAAGVIQTKRPKFVESGGFSLPPPAAVLHPLEVRECGRNSLYHYSVRPVPALRHVALLVPARQGHRGGLIVVHSPRPTLVALFDNRSRGSHHLSVQFSRALDFPRPNASGLGPVPLPQIQHDVRWQPNHSRGDGQHPHPSVWDQPLYFQHDRHTCRGDLELDIEHSGHLASTTSGLNHCGRR